MPRVVVPCLLVWWVLVSCSIGQHEESLMYSTQEGRTQENHKMRRSATSLVTQELLQVIFINQLDSRDVLANLTAATQDNSKLLQDMFQTFTAHLEEYKAAHQGGGLKENVTQDLLREVEALKQRVLQQEADLSQMRYELQLKEQTLQQQETKLQQQQDTVQWQEEVLQEKEDMLQRTEEEIELLKREVHLGEGEKRLVEEELSSLKEEHSQVIKAAEDATRAAEANHATCTSQLQQLTQDNQEITTVNVELRSNNTKLKSQARLTLELEEVNLRLEAEKEGLEQELEACQRNITNLRAEMISLTRPPVDCEDLEGRAMNASGVYRIFPQSSPTGVNVLCEYEDGRAWTVILARSNQNVRQDFAQPWERYKNGFGDPRREYWLGNEILHALTGKETNYRLRVKARSLSGDERSGDWLFFSVGNESSRYQLKVQDYMTSSTLGDGLSSEYNLNNASFSTIDRDRDKNPFGSCTHRYGGGGWWYKWCSVVSPTSPISDGDHDPLKMSWGYFTPGDETSVTLGELKMMVRRL